MDTDDSALSITSVLVYPQFTELPARVNMQRRCAAWMHGTWEQGAD